MSLIIINPTMPLEGNQFSNGHIVLNIDMFKDIILTAYYLTCTYEEFSFSSQWY